ncbi:membrane dipeptidase [Microbacterium sp. 18062]|uniref:membrane dipeptidase n=1 Tax=Microbacterium sp. 18062 TaxID=2681410 RepID=UPI0013596E01|nr:membrane dipeptidase [Microbacterium sp. 18062]
MTLRTRRRPAIALTILTGALALGGCAGGQPADAPSAGDGTAPVSGGTLVFAHDVDPGCIDPQQAASWSLDLGRNIVDSLLEQDAETLEFAPWLATGYEANEDGTEFRFTIREGVTFSDGTALTPETVKGNFDSVKNDLGAKAGYVVGVFSTYVESIVEGQDVVVRFSAPNFPFVQAVSSPSLGIVSESTLTTAPEERCQGAVVGTGPFVLDHYAPTSEVLLTKRADYGWGAPYALHDGEAYLDEVLVQIVTEASVRDGALSSGQVDGIRTPSEGQEATFGADPYWTITRPNPAIVSSLDWNYNFDVVRDENVRLAVLKGIDRQELQETVFGEYGLAATSILSSTILGFEDLRDLLAYDPDGAEDLLEESGWEPGEDGIREKDGERLVISGVVFDYQKATAELQAQQLAKIGIDLQVTLASAANIGEEWNSGEYHFFQHANTGADPDLLRGWFSTSLTNPTTRNFTDTSTDLDELLDRQPGVPNGPERDEILAETQRIILENAYAVPIEQRTFVFSFRDTVRDVRLDAQPRRGSTTRGRPLPNECARRRRTPMASVVSPATSRRCVGCRAEPRVPRTIIRTRLTLENDMTDHPLDIDALMAEHPLVDAHNDWALVLRKHHGSRTAALDTELPELQTDIPRLHRGGVGGQFWASSVPAGRSEAEATVDALEQLDLIHRFVAAYPDALELAYTADDVRRIHGAGRVASLLAVEGGHQIATSLGVLRVFARLGVRYLTLTHFSSTSWADSATDAPRSDGLSEVGRAIVAESNRIGVIVDVSHVADTTARDALASSTSPVVFSHSSARRVTDHVRNAPDDVLELLPANGGVAHVTFVPGFVSADVGAWYGRAGEERLRLGLPPRRGLWPATPVPGVSGEAHREAHAAAEREAIEAHAAAERSFDEWARCNPRPVATLDDVVCHVSHLREVVGIAHVGIGSDFDGSPDQPVGLEDVSAFPRLLTALRDAGWSREDLIAFAGGNTLRVLRENEDAASAPLWPSLSGH